MQGASFFHLKPESLAVTSPNSQALTRRSVLIPTALDTAFTYLADPALPAGTLVEAPFGGRLLIGVVWDEMGDAAVPETKLKPITRVLDLPAAKPEWMRFIDAVASFTLAPRGAVLALAGLAHAAKPVKKPMEAPVYTLQLPVLSAEQQTAADTLCATIPSPRRGELNAMRPLLLDGVTGSGKTEVYFHVIAQLLAANPTGQILVMLPEIALTHQWIDRFTKTFGAPPCVWHSQLTPAARRRAWQAIVRGEARVVVGARSALFLPFAQLSLIVVDEEHDTSFKQEEGVLYQARDMAVLRAREANIPVILSSATPSLETWLNVQSGKYAHVVLPKRYGGASLPDVSVVDLHQQPPERGEFLSPVVKAAMLQTLARGEQVMLFLNRRGYAPLLLCRTCGHRFQCDHCSAWMVVHSRKVGGGGWQVTGDSRATLHCHHCATRKPVPDACPSCRAPRENFAACGPGVERVREEVEQMVASGGWRVAGADEQVACVTPHAPRVTLLSSDEAVAAETWNEIERGEIDILIGTQMVAKGHHFPKLTLVAVIDADMSLEGADLRAGERTYQLLHQLGGRAGRAQAPGKVLLQTYQPAHPIMQALKSHDRAAVLTLEGRIREAGRWPPYGQLAAILLDGKDEAAVRTAAQRLAQAAPQDKRLTVLGPSPAPLSKLRGQYRYRLLVKAEKTIHLQRTLSAWMRDKKFPGVRVKLDVNPYYFL